MSLCKLRNAQYHNLSLDFELGTRSYLDDNININITCCMFKDRTGDINISFKLW